MEVKVRPLIQSNNKTLIPKKKPISISTPLKEISSICERFGIRKRNAQKRKSDLSQILKEYFKSNREYKNHISLILNRLPQVMR